MGVDHLLADDKLPEGVPIVRIMDDGLVGQMSEYASTGRSATIATSTSTPRASARRLEGRGLRRHRSSPHRYPGPGHDRPGHSEEVRRPGFPDGRLEPDAGSRCPASRPSTVRTDSPACWRKATSSSTCCHSRAIPGDCSTPSSSRRCRKAPTSSTWRAADTSWTTPARRARFGPSLAAPRSTCSTSSRCPPEHPYWTHPKVKVTPHIAGATNPRTASPGVIENIKRIRAGQPLINTVDPVTGY